KRRWTKPGTAGRGDAPPAGSRWLSLGRGAGPALAAAVPDRGGLRGPRGDGSGRRWRAVVVAEGRAGRPAVSDRLPLAARAGEGRVRDGRRLQRDRGQDREPSPPCVWREPAAAQRRGAGARQLGPPQVRGAK